MTEYAHTVDVAVIGGGPAGLAAAAAAAREGADVLLIDRNPQLGGILNQCIHDGFGLHAFGEVLTGPEFAHRYLHQALDAGVQLQSHTLVTHLSPDGALTCSRYGARETVHTKATVLAMGCRERTRGMIRIPGTRPAGVYTAGTAQWLTNMANIRIGRRVVILGSGDIGLIMARRLTWEGAEVVAVIEKLPYPSGLPRNINQCLLDYDIPLHLSHSVTCIHGKDRVERVTVSRFDEHGCTVPGSEFELACDTLLLSVGLIPENELSRHAGVALDRTTCGADVTDTYMTSVPGVFSCGNVLHIHDLADWAAEEGERAGVSAAQYVDGTTRPSDPASVAVRPGDGVRYVVPQRARQTAETVLLSLRVTAPRGPTTIRAVSCDAVVGELRLRKAHPATMEQVTIRLSDASGDVEVRCE